MRVTSVPKGEGLPELGPYGSAADDHHRGRPLSQVEDGFVGEVSDRIETGYSWDGGAAAGGDDQAVPADQLAVD